MTTRPPRIPEMLIGRSLPAADRQVVLGDLSEEFVGRAALDGAASARRWYWRQAGMSFGPNVARRVTRWRADRASLTDGSLRDLRDALRSLRAAPNFTVVALVVLTLGIGATTAIFSVVDAVVLRPLPFPEADRLVALGATRPNRPFGFVAPQDFLDWKTQQDVFDDLAADAGFTVTFVTRDDGHERLAVEKVTANLFSVLRTAPALGAVFSAENEIEGNDHVAMISDALWRRRFGADPSIVGRPLRLENGTWEVRAVMPPGFTYPVSVDVDLWVPYVLPPGARSRASDPNMNLQVIGRLRPGIAVEQARSRMTQISDALAKAYPEWFKYGNAAVTRPLRDTIVGPQTRSWMLLLLAAVGFVLLIACVNVASLLLARATSRSRELGVRTALGATRWQLARGLLIESLVLSATGTALGVVGAWWGVRVLQAALPPDVPRAASIAVNLRVLTAAGLASIVAGISFGLVPALHASRLNVTTLLREGGRTATASGLRQRIHTAFVVAEVSLAIVLLVGAGLFIASFARLLAVPVGLDFRGVTSVYVVPSATGTSPEARATMATARIHDMIARVRAIPGVTEASAFSGGLPFSGDYHRIGITVRGRGSFSSNDGPDIYAITPGYLETLRLPLVRGRAFTGADDRVGGEPAVILNEAAAARCFDGADPIGRSIRLGRDGVNRSVTGSIERTVVGVVGNMRPLGPETPMRPEAYIPLGQSSPSYGFLLVRTNGNPELLTPSIRAAIQAVGSMVVPAPVPLERGFARLVAQRRFNMLLLVLFGGLAITIASTGVYGVISNIVAQRTREIGVRMALGASPFGVVGLVMGRVVTLVGAGLVVGLGLAWILAESLRAFLFQVAPHDLSVFAIAPLVLIGAGLVAGFAPARRASKVDPIVALASE